MYFFDTYALIEIFNGNPKYRPFFEADVNLSVLNLGEFYMYLVRVHGPHIAKQKINSMTFNLVEPKKDLVIEAAEFKINHSRQKLSWADCTGYIASQKLGLKFLTGDKEFKDLENVEFVA